VILLEHLSYTYPKGTTVFQDFTWKVGRGEAWAVLGPSGCGKTTLLYLLAGLRFPTSGKIFIDERPLTRPRPHTGLILQDYGLLPWATVRKNAELGLQIRSFYGPDGKHAPDNFQLATNVDPWLERLGLGPVQDQFPHKISGGQRQRTAIARTLALQPDLLLMDEPFLVTGRTHTGKFTEPDDGTLARTKPDTRFGHPRNRRSRCIRAENPITGTSAKFKYSDFGQSWSSSTQFPRYI